MRSPEARCATGEDFKVVDVEKIDIKDRLPRRLKTYVYFLPFKSRIEISPQLRDPMATFGVLDVAVSKVQRDLQRG